MRAALIITVALQVVLSAHAKDGTMQHRSLDEENLLVDRQQSPEVDSSNVSQRQFYRPGSNYRPSYNPGLNSPIRPSGPYIPPAVNLPPPPPYRPFRPSNIDYYGTHMPAVGYRPPGYYPAPGYLNNVGQQPYNNYGNPDGPFNNFQSAGPNGRPPITYLSPSFGFFFRSKDAATDAIAEPSQLEMEKTKVTSADIIFESRR